MKKVLIVIASLTLLAVMGWQLYTSFYLAKTEQQPYTVIKREGELEIRYYPQAVMATVTTPDTTYRAAANRSFRVLAGYIFGGNQQKQSIAMTAPVHMTMQEHSSTMSFVMPSTYSVSDLPMPNDRGVRITEVGEKYVAALRFGGWVDDRKLADRSLELLSQLEALGIKPLSSPWYMGYNPPFQLFNRRNEVAVEIQQGGVIKQK